jgi:hypothetical protein
MMTFGTRLCTAVHRTPAIAVPLVGAALAIVLVSSCAPRHESVVSTRSVTIDQRTLSPPKMVDISIVNLHDEPAADPSMEKVVGTIINEGDRAVTRLSIRVEALDARGNVVDSVTTPPLTQTIDPFGGRGTFEAFLPRNREVTAYHAVAIAR